MDAKLVEHLQRVAWQEFSSREPIETLDGYPAVGELVQTASGHFGRVVMWLGTRNDDDGSSPEEPVVIIAPMGALAASIAFSVQCISALNSARPH